MARIILGYADINSLTAINEKLGPTAIIILYLYLL